MIPALKKELVRMLKEAGTIQYSIAYESETKAEELQCNQLGDLLHQAADVIGEEI